MNMHGLDWGILVAFVVVVVAVAVYTTRYMRSVADFLAGNRAAGRYLLSIDGLNTGAISMVALWELWYKAGYGAAWWGGLSAPIGLIITLSGWVVYRYRQTRAFTLAQFFEIRYSRRFRIFAGILGYLSGVINYGIFPAVAARFFVYYCGIPEYNIPVLGFDLSLSYAAIMALLLGFATTITLAGGQIAIMITDCVQGILAMLSIGVIGIYLLQVFSWDQIFAAFQNAPDPEHASLINPFKTSKAMDFNVWYYLIAAFGAFYNCMAWQGNTGTNAAPKTPHEARMARVIAGWRSYLATAVVCLLPICAFTVMHHPDYASLADSVRVGLAGIGSPTIQTQMTVPMVLGKLLPVGLLGLLATIVFCAMVTTDDTYLHSWGSILIQDVIMPFRKRPFTPEQHIRVLRWSITGVAVFGFLFSLLFRQTQYILMFFAITGAIFLGGAGACIVGGLYWKRGTTSGAWAAMISGSVLSVAALVVQQFPFDRTTMAIQAPSAASVAVGGEPAALRDGVWYYEYEFWKRHEWQIAQVVITGQDGTTTTHRLRYCYAPETAPRLEADPNANPTDAIQPPDGYVQPLPDSLVRRGFVAIRSINGQVLMFYAMVTALLLYVLISLLNWKIFDMDQLLHRGKYALTADLAVGDEEAPPTGLKALLGISPEFTRTDKILYFATLGWSLFWIAVFFFLLILNLIEVRSDWFWFSYWKWTLLLNIGLGFATVIWFSIGGLSDIRDIMRRLDHLQRNDDDDGRVDGGHSAGDPMFQ
jgi:solute:Na+ symporter, SSS family